jgi:PAS domain S-box-containing protein
MKLSGVTRLFLATILAGNLLVGVLVWMYVEKNREHHLEIAATNSANLAKVLAEKLSGDFDRLDVVMLSALDDLSGRYGSAPLSGKEIDRCLVRHMGRIPDINFFRTAEADGDVLHNISPDIRLNIADRGFFTEARDNPAVGLIISPPLLSRSTGKWSVFLARRINRPDGSFGGILYSGYFLETLKNRLKLVDPGRHGTVILRNADMGLLARIPDVAPGVGKPGSKDVPPAIRQLVAQGKSWGSARTISPVDGSPRVSAFRKLGNYPLYVVVALSEADSLAGWYRMAIVAGGFEGLMLILSALLARFLIKEDRGQAVIRETKEILETVFRNSPIGVEIFDRDARLLEANQAAVDMFGTTLLENVGKYSLRADPNYRDPAVWERLDRGESVAHEAEYDFSKAPFSSAFSGKRAYSVITTPIANDGSGKVGYVLQVIDITDRRRADAERQHLRDSLAHARKMEAIGTLAGGIAHDFNNLLTAIMGFTDLSLRKVPAEGEIRENLLEVKAASERARSLVQQILTFAKRSERKVATVDSRRVVAEAMRLLVSIIPRTVSIEQALADDAGFVLADPTELHQVVMNLCTNAYQAMAENGGLLRVTLSNRTVEPGGDASAPGLAPGEYVRLEVTDNGPGMDEAVLSRIFEPYFTTKTHGKGTGLGLAMVHGIVTSIGGTVDVRSEPGLGTTFTVHMPRTEPEPAGVTEPVGEGHLHGHARVLIVDDEPALATLGARILESYGYRVRALTDPLEAIRIFESEPAGFDVIVTDQTMPGLTGDKLVRRAKALRPEIPTVLCTGFSDLIDEEGAKRMGISAYVQKPFDPNMLAAVIASALRGES